MHIIIKENFIKTMCMLRKVYLIKYKLNRHAQLYRYENKT